MSHALYEFQTSTLQGDRHPVTLWHIRRVPYGKWIGPFGSKQKAVDGLMTTPTEPRESVFNEIDELRDDMDRSLQGCTPTGSQTLSTIGEIATRMKFKDGVPLTERERLLSIAGYAIWYLENHPKEKTDEDDS